MMSSCADKTKTQYEVYVAKYMDYCTKNHIVWNKPTINDVLEFIVYLYNTGVGYSSLNSCRSALSLVLKPIDGFVIGEHPMVRRIIKGVFRSRPPRPRYDYTWDVTTLLNNLASLGDNSVMSMLNLSMKLICLLALSTAQRVQTLHSITVNNITFDSDSLFIKITNLVKTSKPGVYQPLLTLKAFVNDDNLCPVSALKAYFCRTLEYRSSHQLFLGLQKPHAPVTVQTLSRWLKLGLMKAGIDTSIFTAHSFRAASTSRALRQGVPIDVIFRQAGWRTTSTFGRFYNREVQPHESLFEEFVLSK